VTRLKIESIAGNPSEADTFAQLLEYLRLAQEASAVIGHLRKANDDDITGDMWILIAEMFKRMEGRVTQLAIGPTRSLTGFKQ
jgi:hypothetical protein